MNTIRREQDRLDNFFGFLVGCNINGQPFWVSIVTGIAAIAITAFVQFLITQFSNVLRWRRSSQKDLSLELTPNYRVAVRIAMICYLIFHGRSTWMYKSNARIHILKNSDKIGSQVNRHHMDVDMIAGHYVTRSVANEFPRAPWFENCKWLWNVPCVQGRTQLLYESLCPPVMRSRQVPYQVSNCD